MTSPLGGARSIQLSYRGMRTSLHPSRPIASTKGGPAPYAPQTHGGRQRSGLGGGAASAVAGQAPPPACVGGGLYEEEVVERRGIEPLTFALRTRRSPS